MSKRYSQEEKDHAIQRLIVNNGDVLLTSEQMGISDRTLLRWRRTYLPELPTTTTTQTASLLSQPLIADDDIAALRDLQQQMLREAYNLVHSIEEAIDEAPLNQRVAALAQLIDRIIKLSAQLPRTNDDDMKMAYHKESYEQDDPLDGTSSETTNDSG